MRNEAINKIKARYNIVGFDERLESALDTALQVAPTDLSVLIQGESGVGKEVLPRIIHDHSPRKTKNYIAINCGSIPEGTIDSELFGHEKGSFTGAVGEHDGYFAAANGGTLFLDEVGELPLSTQARLLRVLETGEYIRVGSNTPRRTDVRIVAATNVQMQKAIREGKFREDLYFRLCTISIKLPPLRDRGDDIVRLFKKFAQDIATRYNMPMPLRLTPEAEQVLMAYKWPGNIRQLRNVVEQMSILCKDDRIVTPEVLRRYDVTSDSTSTEMATVGKSDEAHYNYDKERTLIFGMLNQLANDVKTLKEMTLGAKKETAFSHGHMLEPPHAALPMVSSVRERETSSDDYDEVMPLQPDGYEVHGTEERYEQRGTEAVGQERQQTVQGIRTKDNAHNHVRFVEADADAELLDEEADLNLERMEKKAIEEALRRNRNRRKLAAVDLGISERTLYRKIKDYGLEE